MNQKSKDKPNKSISFISKIFSLLIPAIKSEITSQAGKVNLFIDLIIACVVVVLFLGDKAVQIATVISAIFRLDIANYLSSSTTLTAFILFLCFSIACLVFVYADEHILKKKT